MTVDPPLCSSRLLAIGTSGHRSTQEQQHTQVNDASIRHRQCTPVGETSPLTGHGVRKTGVVTRPFVIVLVIVFVAIAVLTVRHHGKDEDLATQHRSEINRLMEEFESRLQQKDDWVSEELHHMERRFASEKTNITSRHHLEIVRLTRDCEEKLQKKDQSLAHERVELAKKRDEVANEKSALAVERGKLVAREEAVQREEDRQARDLERRQHSNLHWGPLQWNDACIGWKKMRYFAELHGLPSDVDGVEWCRETSYDIFGTPFKKPDFCTKTIEGRVVGHWTRTDEPYCNTMWGNRDDQGCQKGLPGYRRIRMKLWNHHKPWEETWLPLCETTPWPGHGTPDNCESTEHQGIWGEWRVRDEQCD